MEHAQKSNDSPEARPKPAVNPYRDIIIVLGVVILFTIGFFIFRKPDTPPQPPAQMAQNSGDAANGDVLANLPNTYPELVQKGHEQMDAGHYVVAAEIYRRALDLNPDEVDVRVDYGTCLFAMGLPERAEQEFKRALKDHPDHAIATFNMGIVLSHLGKEDSAKMYWQRYLKIEPTGPTADKARELLKQS
jgi:Tfp pilus assembly protein PilF